MKKIIKVKVDAFGEVVWGHREPINRTFLPKRISSAFKWVGTYTVEVVTVGGIPLHLVAEDPDAQYPIGVDPEGPPWFCKDFAKFVGFKVEDRPWNWIVTPHELTVRLKITLVKPS